MATTVKRKRAAATAKEPVVVTRRHGGRPTRDDAAQLGGRILNAATELFFKHGYGVTSIEAVARRARISKRTFYHRFEGKAALFSAVLHRTIAGLRPTAIAPLLTGAEVEAVLHRLATFMVHAAGCADSTGTRLASLDCR